MLVATRTRPVDPVVAAQDTARNLAVMAADAVTRMFDGGRWSPQWPLAAEIRDLARLVRVLDVEIGDMCESAFAESHVETMARSAHELAIQARLACGAGAAALSPVEDLVLFDAIAERTLLKAYSLLAF